MVTMINNKDSNNKSRKNFNNNKQILLARNNTRNCSPEVNNI